MSRRASERGAIAPASLLAAAVVAVAIGTAGYALTSGPTQHEQASFNVQTTPSSTPTAAPSTSPVTESPTSTPTSVDRNTFNVAIYNNSSVGGLAGRTATKAQNVGWNVVETAQWTGATLTASTIYYPPSMQAAAQQLATDLGIAAVKPATSPIKMDRLTVVLTSSYRG